MSEAARNDLYNGLSELLGPDRAETLMSYLPRYDPDDVATRSDVDSIRTDIADLRSELTGDITSVRSELKGDIAELRSEVRSDIGAVKADIGGVRSEFKGDIRAVRSDLTTLRSELRTHGELLFSLQRTLIAGFITFGAALVGLFVAVL